MTYEEAREFISAANKYGGILGVEAVTELLKRLGNPQDQLQIIHIGGTNGKGSTGAFLTAILCGGGYRVGRYVSPTVFSYRERIQISQRNYERSAYQKGHNDFEGIHETKANRKRHSFIEETYETLVNQKMDIQTEAKPSIQGDYSTNGILETGFIQTDYISEEGVREAIERIKPICEQMVQEGLGHPTTFEIETAMTFLYLLWEKVDYLVLEVGMGGRKDATNVLKKPLCTVITSISMDHMEHLGDTLEKIAYEKAGIIKEGCPVISSDQMPEVLQVLRQSTEELQASLTIADSNLTKNITYSMENTSFLYPDGDNYVEYKTRLLGSYQVKNAVLALVTAKTLINRGCSIDNEAIRWGIYHARWNGRFELMTSNPYLFMDGAHNEDAALTLKKSIEIYFTNKRIIFMIGVLADKDYKSILSITCPLADTIITLTPENPRALSSKRLAQEALQYCPKVIDGQTVEKALVLAYEQAGEEDVIIAFGSLSYLGDLKQALKLSV